MPTITGQRRKRRAFRRLGRPAKRCCREASHLLGRRGTASLLLLLRRGAVICRYRFADDTAALLKLLEKYSDVPMSFADACLVRMTETLNDPMPLSTDDDFRIYRRHGRQVVPCTLPR